jgi:hypothetical protein
MDIFGSMGFTFALIGFIFSMSALSRISKLEKKLKETGLLDENFKL